MQVSTIESRVAVLEAIVEKIDNRLDGIEQELRDLRKEVQSNMRWIVGIQITTLLTLGTLILFKLG